MGKIAFVFSGQGAQHAGMAKGFYETNVNVRALFDRAEQMRPGTLEQCFSGTAEELKKTENTQPCLYLADLAASIALSDAGVHPDAVAGFSLGEIPALAFASVFSYEEGFAIACKRGEIMARAAAKVDASMIAVLKMENQAVESLCAQFAHVYPVNYNSPGQLVISGLNEELEVFQRKVREAGGRCMPLAVGGGFHSPFMDEASAAFGAYLGGFDLYAPAIRTYSNFTAEPYDGQVAYLLENQINHPVRWETIVNQMIKSGVDTVIESGVGTVLQKLIGRIDPAVKSFAVEEPEGLARVLNEMV